MIIFQLKTKVQDLLLGSQNYAHQLRISKKVPEKNPIHSGEKLTELIKYSFIPLTIHKQLFCVKAHFDGLVITPHNILYTIWNFLKSLI